MSVVKDFEKVNFLKLREKAEKSKVVIAHERIATSGYSKEFIQPFEDKGFVFVHNGIVRSYERGGKSDTFMMFKDFTAEVAKLKSLPRDDAVVKALKEIFDKLEGSWSVMVYDKQAKKAYYLKNTSTNMYAWKGYGFLYMSTVNIKPLFEYKVRDIDVDDHVIYMIDAAAELKEVGRVEESPVSTYKAYGGYATWDGPTVISSKGKKKGGTLQERIVKDDDGEIVGKVEGVCAWCDKKSDTLNYDIDYDEYICNDCLENAEMKDQRWYSKYSGRGM
jgi:hypothetical protein